MTIVGYAIMVIGLVLIVVGVVGAAFAVAGTRPQGIAPRTADVGSVLKSLPEILAALGKSPPWLAAVVVGCALVWFGNQACIGGWPFA